MQKRVMRQVAFLLGVLLVVGLCLVDASAQSRRRRRTRRPVKKVERPVITNPDIAAPGEEETTTADGEKIISTADQSVTEPAEDKPATARTRTKTPEGEMQKTINSLSNQVDRLNQKLTQMQETDRARLDLERLTQAETRAESLRSQQVEVESKLSDLQSKLELTDYQLRPENIERAAGYGTLHPEEARDSRRRQLESEKARIQSQIKILETSRVRLEAAVRTADSEVDSLRQKLEMQQAPQDASGVSPNEAKPNKPEQR